MGRQPEVIPAVAGTALRLATVLLAALVLVSSLQVHGRKATAGESVAVPPCDEIYVVGDGESLHSISAKCDDPFIVERNPHVHESDDVFPGLILHIVPARR